MIKRMVWILCLSGFSFFTDAEACTPVFPTDRENVALARMSALLDHLTPLIEEAKRCQSPTARVQFRYDALQQDIHKIKAGIQAKFDPPSLEARVIPPIRGDYLVFNRRSK